MVVIPRFVGYLLLGVGLVILAKWAVTYLVSPDFFRPGVGQVVFVVALFATVIGVRQLRVR